MKLFTLILLISGAIAANSKSKKINPIPVTFYLGDLGVVTADSNNYVYYHVLLCEQATQNSSHVELTIALPNNPTWDTNVNGYVMVQVSTCLNSFTQSCVIAQNYIWGTHVKAVPIISWKYNQETNFYIRALAGNLPTQFSMELQFLNDANQSYYNWTTNYPFGGTAVNKEAAHLYQYWKSKEQYNVKNLNLMYFGLAYCNEDTLINGIDVAIVTPPSDSGALITAYACPATIDLQNCTQSAAKEYGWVNSRVSSFNLLECPDETQRHTDQGIYVAVEGYGGDITKDNLFALQATTRGG